jgi:NAD(P)-dependent dehydrogenase (short-subunit alcohol dehydrogenase family)
VDELRGNGGEAVAITADLTDSSKIPMVVTEAISRLGSLDVLINNAGIIEVGPLDHMTRADFEQSMQLHFWAPLDLMRAVIPHMRERGGGRIVNIASIGGQLGVPHLVPYCASKFALVGLSDAMRAELARDGIQITTVSPGLMRTGSHVHAKFKGDHGAEFGWFSVAAALPLISISGERAGAQILAACRAGRPALTFPLVSRLAIAGNAALPNLTAKVNAFINEFLPKRTDSSGDQLRSGWESQKTSNVPAWETRRVDSAIERNNENGSSSRATGGL